MVTSGYGGRDGPEARLWGDVHAYWILQRSVNRYLWQFGNSSLRKGRGTSSYPSAVSVGWGLCVPGPGASLSACLPAGVGSRIASTIWMYSSMSCTTPWPCTGLCLCSWDTVLIETWESSGSMPQKLGLTYPPTLRGR